MRALRRLRVFLDGDEVSLTINPAGVLMSRKGARGRYRFLPWLVLWNCAPEVSADAVPLDPDPDGYKLGSALNGSGTSRKLPDGSE